MSNTELTKIDHYRADGLLARVQAAVTTIAPAGGPITVDQLASMDQFHTRGALATLDLACAAEINEDTRILDLGCGLGGPARFLAAKFGADVTGIDQSASYIETATYLSERTCLQDQTRFHVGDAANPPVHPASFDLVLLQHVAMNIADRAALYSSAHRALKPGGILASYDIVSRGSEILYPVPWAREPSSSFLLTVQATCDALEQANFVVTEIFDETQKISNWFASMQMAFPPPEPNLAIVLGSEFAAMAANLSRNISEGRVDVVTLIAVAGGEESESGGGRE